MNEAYASPTFTEFVLQGEDDNFTHYNFSILELIDNIEIPISNIIENDYLDELRSIAEDIQLSDTEYRIYKYKPHLLSIVLYDTPELYFIILALNDMASKKEFTERNIKLVSKENMINILNMIINAESEYIEDNRVKLDEEREKKEI